MENKWLSTVHSATLHWLRSTEFDSAYLFGSLLHNDGQMFEADTSDVDIITCFETAADYFTRSKALIHAIDHTQELNLTLLSKFSREIASNPIVSIVPVTTLELERGLHKSGSVDFYVASEFLSIERGVREFPGSSYAAGGDGIQHGAYDAARHAQAFRHRSLSIAPNGRRVAESYDGPDVLPKDLTRCAAQVRFSRGGVPNDQRFDVNEGIVYALQLLVARREENAAVESLTKRMVVRMGGRGSAEPLSVDDQVLLWEILVDDVLPPVTPVDFVSDSPLRIPRISPRTRSFVAERASYRCQYPTCGIPLGDDGIGQIAFIVSPMPHGPRHEEGMTPDEAVDPTNLLLLCPTHHRIIDADPNSYSAEELRKWVSQDRFPSVARFTADNLFTIARLLASMI